MPWRITLDLEVFFSVCVFVLEFLVGGRGLKKRNVSLVELGPEFSGLSFGHSVRLGLKGHAVAGFTLELWAAWLLFRKKVVPSLPSSPRCLAVGCSCT